MIQVDSICFSYNKGEKTIDNLTLSVPKGSFYGFLGANGSGKTTTIRLILGLCKIGSGRILIDGDVINRNTIGAFRKIGSLIETPTFYSHMTGEENLLLYAKYYGLKPIVVLETLNIVGLTYAARKKAGFYSLGMKQRLGLALTLLHDPELLILDEPLNGLDPKGIAEIRDLLLSLNKDKGKTIFISSHLLSEIENTCDSICIIDYGKKLFSGGIDDLRRHITGKMFYRIICDKPDFSSDLLRLKYDIETNYSNDLLTFSTEDNNLVPEIIRLLVNHGIMIYEVSKIENNLEELYLKLTNTKSHDLSGISC